MKTPIDEECRYKDPNKVIGIDLGIKTLITGSDGLHIDNPKFLKKSERRLKHLQRSLSKKVKGSKNRIKAKKKVSDLHLKIKNQRLDYLEKITTFTTKEYSIIGMETLNIEGMKKDPTKSKAVSDCSWSFLKKGIKDKQVKYNCRVIELNQWFPSSQLCNKCGHQKKELKLKDREYKCNNCSYKEDRDLNAAMNIRDLTILKLNSEVTLGLKRTIKVCGDLSHCSDQNKDQDKFESMKQKALYKWI